MAGTKLPTPKQKGQLIWRNTATGGCFYGRFYATVQGERIRVFRCLDVRDKSLRALARRKLSRLIAENETAPEEAKRPETFEEAARRIVEAQKAEGMATAKDRLRRLEMHVFEHIGTMVPADIRAAHVRAVLETARDAGKARETMMHIKHDIGSVLADLWRAELLPENVTARVKVPEALADVTARSKKERAVLSDSELARYLAWVHPEKRQRMAVLERQTMACVARMFGGLRTSDLHALRWEGFDLPAVLDGGQAAGGFETGIAPRVKGSRRAKGGRPQRLAVPAMLRPILRDWWEHHGRPREGLVFPARRGARVGEVKRQVSHAEALRRDLRRVFGLEVLTAETRPRSGKRGPVTCYVWKPSGRDMTPRERELLEETEWTLPVDFHSWRRAFNQALADAGVNSQTAQALAGHSSLEAHERYLRNSGKVREVPETALPRLKVRPRNGIRVVGTLHRTGRIMTPHAYRGRAKAAENSPFLILRGLPKPKVARSNRAGSAADTLLALRTAVAGART